MFSGIIEKTEKAKSFKKTKDGLRVEFPFFTNQKITIGESINIDGVCSTVEDISTNSFTVFYMPETLSKTNLGIINKNHEFNFEKSLTLNSLVGGHLVSGHIDTTAKVIKLEKEDESTQISFKISPKFSKYIIYKGSISVNGVSLTIVEIKRDSFKVSLIPHTLKITNLGNLKNGDTVNIEVDMIAKYLEKLTK